MPDVTRQLRRHEEVTTSLEDRRCTAPELHFPQLRLALGMSVSGRGLPLLVARSGTEQCRCFGPPSSWHGIQLHLSRWLARDIF